MPTTQSLCLQQLGFLIYPSLQFLIVSKEDRVFLGLRMEYAQFMSITDMEKAIVVPDCDLKQMVSHYKYSHK